MESSWKKPAVSIKAPRPSAPPSSDEAKDAQDEVELERLRLKKEEAANADKIGQLLNANYFWTEWTFPFLRNEHNQSMSVSRFYPKTAVAVDLFTHITPHEQAIIERKRKLFNENLGIVDGKETRVRYGALDWSMPLADLLPQIGEVPKVGD